MPFYTFVIRHLATGASYAGYTRSLSRLADRLNRQTPPVWEHLHTEVFDTQDEAIKREYFFNSAEGKQWLQAEGIL